MQALHFMGKSARKSRINPELVNDISQGIWTFTLTAVKREFDNLPTDYLKSQDFLLEIADG